jgi:hypothetical protein
MVNITLIEKLRNEGYVDLIHYVIANDLLAIGKKRNIAIFLCKIMDTNHHQFNKDAESIACRDLIRDLLNNETIAYLVQYTFLVDILRNINNYGSYLEEIIKANPRYVLPKLLDEKNLQLEQVFSENEFEDGTLKNNKSVLDKLTIVFGQWLLFWNKHLNLSEQISYGSPQTDETDDGRPEIKWRRYTSEDSPDSPLFKNYLAYFASLPKHIRLILYEKLQNKIPPDPKPESLPPLGEYEHRRPSNRKVIFDALENSGPVKEHKVKTDIGMRKQPSVNSRDTLFGKKPSKLKLTLRLLHSNLESLPLSYDAKEDSLEKLLSAFKQWLSFWEKNLILIKKPILHLDALHPGSRYSYGKITAVGYKYDSFAYTHNDKSLKIYKIYRDYFAALPEDIRLALYKHLQDAHEESKVDDENKKFLYMMDTLKELLPKADASEEKQNDKETQSQEIRKNDGGFCI